MGNAEDQEGVAPRTNAKEASCAKVGIIVAGKIKLVITETV